MAGVGSIMWDAIGRGATWWNSGIFSLKKAQKTQKILTTDYADYTDFILLSAWRWLNKDIK